MRKIVTGGFVALALLVASSSLAVVQKTDAGQPAQQSRQSGLGQVAAKVPSPQFATAVMDPAQCNYEYVDVEASMIVRTQLKMTCAIRQ